MQVPAKSDLQISFCLKCASAFWQFLYADSCTKALRTHVLRKLGPTTILCRAFEPFLALRVGARIVNSPHIKADVGE